MFEEHSRSELDGRVALVTGAGGRIGRAICVELARRGATVVASDVDGEGLRAVGAALGGAHLAIAADLSAPGAAAELVRSAITAERRLDVLVNNAAVLDPGGSVVDCPPELYERIMAVNVRAPFQAIAAAVPVMIAQGGGAIVNVASVLGLVGLAGFAAYCTSKGALVELTRQVAVEFAAQGIRCNAVCPGTVAPASSVTDSLEWASARARMPVDRIGEPEEIARVVAFLAGDDASFMHGALVPVDGGYTAR